MSSQPNDPLEVKEKSKDVPFGQHNDPLKHSAPQEEGNHWDHLLQPLLEKDQQQCDAWKEEVENLLIFAGLFSAVVTAFVVETYKGLQPDTNDTVIALLTEIAANLDGSRNGTTLVASSASLATEGPSQAISRVNIFWFISLVLSLTDVLVGIVSLQWLRAHRRYPIQITPRDKFALFNMRREGLDAWHVPHVFSALPMLLQASLVLFLIGLTDFLFLIAPLEVFIPIAVVIALPILFIAFTTVIPSLQCILPPIIYFQIWRSVPSECPYKSPQASTFSFFLTPVIRWICGLFCRVQYGFWQSMGSFQLRQDTTSGGPMTLDYRADCFKAQFEHNIDSRSFGTSVDHQLAADWFGDVISPVGDWILGLRFACQEGAGRYSVYEACYECLLELAKLRQDSFSSMKAWCYYIISIMDTAQDENGNLSLFFMDPEVDVPEAVIIDELSVAAMRYLSGNDSHPERVAHEHEIYIRLLKYYLPKFINRPRRPSDSEYNEACYVSSYWYNDLIAPRAISEPMTNMLNDFLIDIVNFRIPISDQLVTVEDALPMFFNVTRFGRITSATQDRNQQLSTLRLMETLTRQHLLSDDVTDMGRSPVPAFVFMGFYAGDLLYRASVYTPLPPHIVEEEVKSAVSDLVKLLCRYENEKLGIRLGNPSPSSNEWPAFREECDRIGVSGFTQVLVAQSDLVLMEEGHAGQGEICKSSI